jgi:hypothetical protein|tara:strand:- start:198 stop:1220 length:1023 start_codon:yes stop_codon:yes gene_type:complete
MLQRLRNALTRQRPPERQRPNGEFSSIVPEQSSVPAPAAMTAVIRNPIVPDYVRGQGNKDILEFIKNYLNRFIQSHHNTQHTDQHTQAKLIHTFEELDKILRLPHVTQPQQDCGEAIALRVIPKIVDPNLKMTLFETLAATLCDTGSQKRSLLATTIIDSTRIDSTRPSEARSEYDNRAATCLETIINSLRTTNDGSSNGSLENLITGMTHTDNQTIRRLGRRTIRNLGRRLNSPFKYLGEATIPSDELPTKLKDAVSFIKFTKAEPMYVICTDEHNNGKLGTNWPLYSRRTINEFINRGRTTDPYTRCKIIGIKKVIIDNSTHPTIHPTINLPGALPPS